MTPQMFYSTEFLNGNYFFKKRKRGTFFFCVVQHSLMPTYEMSATTIETSELPVTVISRAEETILLFLNKQGFFLARTKVRFYNLWSQLIKVKWSHLLTFLSLVPNSKLAWTHWLSRDWWPIQIFRGTTPGYRLQMSNTLQFTHSYQKKSNENKCWFWREN